MGITLTKNLKAVIFALMISATTLAFFNVFASEPNPVDPRDPVGDLNLRSWCPPSSHPGLAVICGTVVTNSVVDVGNGTRVPFTPVDNQMVAVYEDNPISSTGTIEGALTNVFASTTTNELGRFRLVMRRVNPPNLRVNLIFFCGGSRAHHQYIDSWHNTWDMFTQIDCKPKLDNRVGPGGTGSAELDIKPPFPLRANSVAGFLGCTNDRVKDTPIGLAKKYEPVVNNIISEKNYDHRFTLNTVYLNTGGAFPIFITVPAFVSPGGLWEPDCLLRNEAGTYQCATPYQICNQWENPPIGYRTTNYGQPCSGVDGCDTRAHGLSSGYTAEKLYARTDCNGGTCTGGGTGGGGGTELDTEDVDGVLCDRVPGRLAQMPSEDYLTRPFYKFIPKSPGEYEVPFRRFEYRNNMKDFTADPYAPQRWVNTYLGSTANTGKGPPTATFFRSFMAENSTTPDLPSCEALYKTNMPFQDKGSVLQNRLVNNGFMTGLAEPYGTMEEIYYSGARDLSDFVCEESNGDLVRLCEIQVPWGPGEFCNVYTGNCRNDELSAKLNASLNRLGDLRSMITEPSEKERYHNNIVNSLAACGGSYKKDKMFFAEDLMFKVGNSQIGMHSDTQNDSIPSACERLSPFEPAYNEQECEALTGSRVALQDGGNAHLNSFGTVDCAINPQGCINKPDARPLMKVLLDPISATDEEMYKKRYLNNANWNVDSIGANQIAMCSISNTYNVDITGPAEEAIGLPQNSKDPAVQSKAGEIGGYFDNLFSGNFQHKGNWVSGTATWYLSEKAAIRDKIMVGATWSDQFQGPNDIYEVGTESANGIGTDLVDTAFHSLLGREIWDSMLTLGGGDAALHGLDFDLHTVTQAIVNSLKGSSTWKSYGNRGNISLTPWQKPYYKVTFDYPLAENIFKDSFRLPGELPDGTHVQPELIPEEWGPGHICYNFDTQVSGGQFCGTYREPPYGVSRTCRLDECVNFNRVETATCTCRIALSGGIPIPGGRVRCSISPDSREVRNLIISDCSFENKLKCVILQETSRVWEAWPLGYDQNCSTGWTLGPDGRRVCPGNSHYYRDDRTGDETTGTIFPPDDIDFIISHEDHDICVRNPDTGVETCSGTEPSIYKPEHIEDEACFDKYPERFEDNNNDGIPDNKSYSYGLVGSPGPDRPRCTSSVAGPFRKDPNFGSVTSDPPTVPPLPGLDGEINNCNGYIKITDSALRASQYAPYERYGQQQKDLTKSSEVGIVAAQTFAPPYMPAHKGQQLNLLNTQDTNEAPVFIQDAPRLDVFTKGQKVRAQATVGDTSRIRAFFAYPALVPLTARGAELHTLKYHCNMLSTYVPDGNPTGKQKEIRDELTGYNPELSAELIGGDIVDGWYCPVAPAPEKPITDLASPSTNCNINNWGRCTDYVRELWTNAFNAEIDEIEGNNLLSREQKDARINEVLIKLQEVAAFEFPSYFRQVMDFAAYQTNTPAGALLAVMYSEGGLNYNYYKEWGDNAWVFNASVPWWGQMDLGSNSTCNNLVWTAQGPYKILQAPLRLISGKSTNSDPEIARRFCGILGKAGRPKQCLSVMSASRCNFLDASVAASFLLNPEAGDGGHSCGGFDFESAMQRYSGSGTGDIPSSGRAESG